MSVPFRSKKSAVSVVSALTPDPHAPTSAMLEIADRCNEVCVHCYQVQGQKGEMTTEQVFRVLDQLAEAGVLFLTISGGEPTLRSDFLQIVEHARKQRFAVKIFTNGLRLDDQMVRRLAELAVQEVQMSLYSHRSDIHDWVTGVPGSFEKTVSAAKSLVAERVAVVLKTPAMAVNAADVSSYIDFVTGLGAEYIFDAEVVPRENGDRTTQQLQVANGDYVRLMRDPRLAGVAIAPDDATREKPLDRSVCGACSGSIHIEPNGEMRPCTQLSVPVGNALHDGVQRAWSENESAQAIRHLTWADLHGCRDCDLRAYCGRCFATAQVEAGDALGPYAAACRRAVLEYEVAHGFAPQVLPGARQDTTVGPFERVETGVFRASEDVVTEADEALARRLPWSRTRTDLARATTPLPAPASGLVQIRRPNQREPRWERLPDSGGDAAGRRLVQSPAPSAEPAEEGR